MNRNTRVGSLIVGAGLPLSLLAAGLGLSGCGGGDAGAVPLSGPRQQACFARDVGHEEHSSQHGGWGLTKDQACGLCSPKPFAPHDRCNFRCFLESYDCTYRLASSDSSSRGYRYTEWGITPDEAQFRAERECERAGGFGARCVFDGCTISGRDQTNSGSCPNTPPASQGPGSK